jgi:hypothetical protein
VLGRSFGDVVDLLRGTGHSAVLSFARGATGIRAASTRAAIVRESSPASFPGTVYLHHCRHCVGLHLTPNARAAGVASPSFSLLWVHVWVDYALDCSIACRAARAVVQGCSDLRRPTCKAGTLPVCLTLSDRRACSCTRAAALLLVSLLHQGESYFGELTYSGVTAIMGPYATAAEAAGTSIVMHPHGAAACRRGALLALVKLVFNPCLAFVACQTGAYDEILVRHCGLCAAAHSNYLTGLVNGADRVYPPKWLAPSHSYAVDSTPPLYSVCTPCSCTTCLLSPSPQPCTASTLCVSLVTTRSLALVGHHLPPHLRRCRLPALRLPRHPQSC